MGNKYSVKQDYKTVSHSGVTWVFFMLSPYPHFFPYILFQNIYYAVSIAIVYPTAI